MNRQLLTTAVLGASAIVVANAMERRLAEISDSMGRIAWALDSLEITGKQMRAARVDTFRDRLATDPGRGLGPQGRTEHRGSRA